MIATARDADLQLLALRPNQLRFIVEDGVFAQVKGLPPQRVGRLSDHLRARAKVSVRPARPGAGSLGLAASYAENLDELAFIVSELIPTLRANYPDRRRKALDPRALDRGLRGARDLARDFQRVLAGTDWSLDPTPALPSARRRSAPSPGVSWALAGTVAIPLEPVRCSRPGELTVAIESRLFRYRLESARPLSAFLEGLQAAADLSAQHTLARNPGLRAASEKFVKAVESLLRQCGLRKSKLAFRVPQGLRLELQHRGGAWTLVCGPARNRCANRAPFYIGLAIQGRSRAEWLAKFPGKSTTADGFYTDQGHPKHAGYCVGELEQYRHLRSDRSYTDAEAVLFWLGAGIITESHRSAFHQQCLAERNEKTAALRPTLPFRSMRLRACR